MGSCLFFVLNKNFPDTGLDIDFRNLEFSKWHGISYKKGGYTSKSRFLENYFEKIGKFVDQFNETYDFPFELMFEMGPRFDMFFYCNFEKKEDPSMSDENPNSYNL